MQADVVSLFIYPVKACAGLAVPQLAFDETLRIAGDREWVVTDAAGQVTWQGEHARLALVRPAFEDGLLVLRAGGDVWRLERNEAMAECKVSIWNDAAQRNETFAAHEAGPTARRFLRAATGADLRLMRLGPEARSRDSVNPVHLMSQASLDELNQTLEESGHPPAAMARFRPNLVLDGEALLPFLEEHLESLRWDGDKALHLTQLCVRCIVPNVDPQSARVDAEPGPTVARLSAMRRPGAPSTMGIYLRPLSPCVLTQGSRVELALTL